jgi:uncharacterized protein YicC (UPF0701 family)
MNRENTCRNIQSIIVNTKIQDLPKIIEDLESRSKLCPKDQVYLNKIKEMIEYKGKLSANHFMTMNKDLKDKLVDCQSKYYADFNLSNESNQKLMETNQMLNKKIQKLNEDLSKALDDLEEAYQDLENERRERQNLMNDYNNNNSKSYKQNTKLPNYSSPMINNFI